MLGFHTIFPDVASKECRTITPFNDDDLPGRTFLFMEAYCPDPGCDRRRVMINVVDADRREQVATINYGFEPPKPPFEDEGQTFLDPLNPQSEHSHRFLDIFREMIERDEEYAKRLRRHYQMFERVVEDPGTPHRPCFARRSRRLLEMGSFRGASRCAAMARRSERTTLARAGAGGSTSAAVATERRGAGLGITRRAALAARHPPLRTSIVVAMVGAHLPHRVRA